MLNEPRAVSDGVGRPEMTLEEAMRLAVANVAGYGDTDVFPYPLENHVFHDKSQEVVDQLLAMANDFKTELQERPPLTDNALQAVGYTGFRWATQIDPIWNAYLLGQVIHLGEQIEAARLPREKNAIFSYRFKPDASQGNLFDKDVGWFDFQTESVERARASSYVLKTDIANFYPRVYHHRLENALQQAAPGQSGVGHVMKILQSLANNVSYGLPVGGPGARLLSELLLNNVDRLLAAEGISFCRFSDDYHVFAESREEAYKALIFLNEKLQLNEGLSLQKSKTRIVTTEEFLATSEVAEEPGGGFETRDEQTAREFLSVRLRYDPYSPTADEDYERIKAQVMKFDVVGLLARELRKPRLHQAMTRKLISAIRALDDEQRDLAVRALLDNLEALYPVFSNVMIVLKVVADQLPADLRNSMYEKLRALAEEGSYILRVPVHMAFALRVLADDPTDETEAIINRVYSTTPQMFLKRDMIAMMARRRAVYWLSDKRKGYDAMDLWQKRSTLVASYQLGDEGKHWRNKVKRGLRPFETLLLGWAADRSQQPNWSVPV